MPGNKSGIEKLRGYNYFRTVDYYLIVPILMLTIIGLYVLSKVLAVGYDAYPGNLYRQITAAVIGIVITIIICLLDTHFLWIIGWTIYGVALFLLCLVPIDGYDLTWKWGADAWLNLPVIGNFQPSELAKIGLVMGAADIFERMSDKRITMKRGVLYLALTYGPPMLLILKQPDFGTAMVIVFSFVCILFVWGMKYRYFLLAASGVIVAGIPFVWRFYLEDYQKRRILSLVFEGADPASEFNLVQSKAAIASGGLTGNNTGVLIKVPVKESDFVFSAISEHLGFIGTTAVLFLAFFFLCRCLFVASRASRKSYSFIVVGLAASFAFHFIENMGMSVGLLPITGIPLPFISLGGTAMMVNYISFGIILNISMEAKQV
ncbi:MAG: rod shape-determining protein RodA [Clostridiales bacterium]|nr:rod shape-determining protein RodA [Clostridiales bacterium]MBR6483883.1 rod shape-determining protein RodA [Clostridiales bacterium]